MTDAVSQAPAALLGSLNSARRIGRWFIGHPPVVTLLLIVIVCIGVGTLNPSFWQIPNLFDMARSSVVRGLFALGVFVVLASGGLDVSFTAIAALVMYSITMLVSEMAPTMSIGVIFLIAAVGGTMLGAGNGVLVSTLRAPSLIVTIGTQYVIRGFLLTFVGTAYLMNIPASMDAFGHYALLRYQSAAGATASLPAFFLVFVAAALVTWYLLKHTLMGRAIFAAGGNPNIAERLGYNLRVVHIFVFSYAGLLAGIAGIVHVASDRLANPFDLVGTELEVIAAVIFGGARITGGSGSVIGTILGVILITLVNNVLILIGVPSTWQLAIIGAFLILAGIMFSVGARRAGNA